MHEYGRRIPSDGECVLRILVSFVVILVSIATIYIVILKITDIKIFEKINIKEETHDSLNIITDTDSGTSLFITDEKGLKFRKEDKSFAREEWVEKNGELFYFDTAGYGLNSELKIDGQVYSFENGKLKNIKRDTSYVSRAQDDLFSSIESSQYLVWLSNDEKEKGFYPIKYHQYSDDSEDYLGTASDKQFASPNMIKIYMSNIYYLAVGKGTTYAGRLYRMRPGAIHKETIGVGVTGFIVLSDDVVYYCDGDKVIKAKSWKGIELKLPDDEELNEEGDIVTKIASISDLKGANKNVTDESNIDLELPLPDKVVEKKVNEEVLDDKSAVVPKISNNDNSQEQTTETKIAFNIKDLFKSSTEKVEKEEVIETGGPKVVEVEAPR